MRYKYEQNNPGLSGAHASISGTSRGGHAANRKNPPGLQRYSTSSIQVQTYQHHLGQQHRQQQYLYGANGIYNPNALANAYMQPTRADHNFMTLGQSHEPMFPNFPSSTNGGARLANGLPMPQASLNQSLSNSIHGQQFPSYLQNYTPTGMEAEQFSGGVMPNGAAGKPGLLDTNGAPSPPTQLPFDLNNLVRKRPKYKPSIHKFQKKQKQDDDLKNAKGVPAGLLSETDMPEISSPQSSSSKNWSIDTDFQRRIAQDSKKTASPKPSGVIVIDSD